MTGPLYEIGALRAELCQWLGSTSFSLLRAQGVPLTPEQTEIADREEDAARACQVWLNTLKQSGEESWSLFIENRT